MTVEIAIEHGGESEQSVLAAELVILTEPASLLRFATPRGRKLVPFDNTGHVRILRPATSCGQAIPRERQTANR